MAHRSSLLLLALAALSVSAAPSFAQTADPAAPASVPPVASSPDSQSPAPIQRVPMPYPNRYSNYTTTLTTGQVLAPTRGVASAQPAQGVFLRVGINSSVRAVALSDQAVELRVEHGLANLDIHHPSNGAQILVHLPGGETSLLKDGLYTFNADTNTVRVLRGEAAAYSGSDISTKPVKVKEYHQLVFGAPKLKSISFEPFQARADVLPAGRGFAGNSGGGYGEPYGYGPYGDGFYGGYPYPFYAYGYPWGFYGYPYGGFGYPFGFGLGFGFYGGYGRFGGFRR